MLPDVRSTRANASRKRQRPLLEVKTHTSKRRQHPASNNNIHNFDPALARRTGHSVAVLEQTGHTQGWLLVDPDNANDWYPAWVSFDPHVPLLLVQLGHRHRVHDGSLLTLEIDRAHAHVVMTSSNAATASTFANTAQQGLSAFRVKVRENSIVCFAATQDHVAQAWVTALRNAIAQRTNPPPQIDFEPPRWHARPATPLKDLCKHFFYEHMQTPGNGSQARQDPVLTSAMRACDLAITWDNSLQTWYATNRRDPQHTVPLMQALARGFLARRQVSRIRMRRAERRRQRLIARARGPHDDFPHIKRVLTFAPRHANKAATKLQALRRRYLERFPFLALRNGLIAFQQRWRHRSLARHTAALKMQLMLRRQWAREVFFARKFLRERAIHRTASVLVADATSRALHSALRRSQAATIIQTQFRRIRTHRTSSRIQARCRGVLVRRHIARKQTAAIRIQTCWRRHLARVTYRLRLARYRLARDHALAYLARKQFRSSQRASTKIATRFRTMLAAREHKRKRWAATLLQRIVRIWMHVRKWRAHLRALAITQKIARGWLVRHHHRRSTQAAIALQAFARSFTIAKPALQRKRRAATTLSKHTRGRLARRALHRHIAARAIQTRWRACHARQRFRSIWNTVRAGLVSFQAVLRGAQERTTRCRLAAHNLEATSFRSKSLELPITMEKTLALLNLGAACGRLHATRSLEKSSVKASHRRGLVAVLCAQETARMHEALAHMRWLQCAIANIQWRLPAHGPRLIVGVAALQALADAQMMLGDTSLAAGLTTPIKHTRAYIMSTLLSESQSDCTWQTHDNDSVSRHFQDMQSPHEELLPRVQRAQQRLEDMYTKTTRDIAEMLVDLDAATIDAERHGDLLVDDIDRAERKMAHARADARPASLAAFAAMQRLDRAARHRLPCVVDDARVEFANARCDRCSIEEKIASLPFEAATDLRDLFQRVKARLEKRFAEVEHLRDAMHATSAWIPLLLEFAVVEMMTPLQLLSAHVQHLAAAQDQDQVARERLSRVRAAACLVCKCAGDTCHHVPNFRAQYHAARAALEQAFLNLASAAHSLPAVDFCNLILDNLVNYLNLVREPMQMWCQETASLFTSQLADRQQIRQAFSDRAQDLREKASRLVVVEERAKTALCSAEADPRNFWWSHVLGQRVIPSFLAKERARVASLITRDDPVPEDARGEMDTSSSIGSSSSSIFASDSSSDETMSTCSCSSCEREREHVAPGENGLFEELLAERLRKLDQAEVEAAKAAVARSQQRQERRSSTFLLHAARATVFPRAHQARVRDRAAVTLQCALRTWRARREHRRLRDVMLERARIVLAALRIQGMCRRWLTE